MNPLPPLPPGELTNPSRINRPTQKSHRCRTGRVMSFFTTVESRKVDRSDDSLDQFLHPRRCGIAMFWATRRETSEKSIEFASWSLTVRWTSSRFSTFPTASVAAWTAQV
jgi:hypothetical protein